jgi:hypothetical protein
LLIVTAVIFLFMGSLRAVMVPVIAMPLSLVGTFFVMLLLGYTINLHHPAGAGAGDRPRRRRRHHRRRKRRPPHDRGGQDADAGGAGRRRASWPVRSWR